MMAKDEERAVEEEGGDAAPALIGKGVEAPVDFEREECLCVAGDKLVHGFIHARQTDY